MAYSSRAEARSGAPSGLRGSARARMNERGWTLLPGLHLTEDATRDLGPRARARGSLRIVETPPIEQPSTKGRARRKSAVAKPDTAAAYTMAEPAVGTGDTRTEGRRRVRALPDTKTGVKKKVGTEKALKVKQEKKKKKEKKGKKSKKGKKAKAA